MELGCMSSYDKNKLKTIAHYKMLNNAVSPHSNEHLYQEWKKEQ